MTATSPPSPISRFRRLSNAMLRTRFGDAGAMAAGIVLGGLLASPSYAVLGALVGAGGAMLLRLGFGANAWTREATELVHDISAIEKAKPAAEGGGFDLLEELPVPLLVLDARSMVLSCSQDARDVLRINPVGRRLSAVFRSPVLLEAVGLALDEREAKSFEFTAVRVRDTRFRAELRPLNKAGAEDNTPSLLLVLHDITQQRQVDEMRIDFVANASHELRTPLAAIGGLIETLRGAARNDDANRDRFLGIIAEQADRMTRLVNDLLSLSRIELEENIVPTETQDLRAIAIEAANAMASLAAQTGNQIEIDLPEDLSHVVGVRDEIMQVFVNLIGNAMKYGGPDRPVRIFQATPLRQVRGMIGVTVEDFGPGIDRAMIPRLTERFFRVNKQDSLKRGGTGLGLAIVKHIMHHHRGTLAITSTLGKGSQFTVLFPVKQDKSAQHSDKI